MRGITSVMRTLGMVHSSRPHKLPVPCVANASSWIRAPQSGILRTLVALGRRVHKGEVLGIIADPFGESELPVLATNPGILIGRTQLPLVNEGEALFHLARFNDSKEVAAQVEVFQEVLPPVLEDDPPII